MKIVRSKLPSASPTVTLPYRGRYRVEFVDGRATVPDDVAILLQGYDSSFYQIVGDVHEIIPGAKVLVIRDCGLGDVLLATPLIRKLHELTERRIDVLTNRIYVPLFDGNKYVNTVNAIESDSGNYASWDIVLDLRLIVENAENQGINLHRCDAFCDYVDIKLPESERYIDYCVTKEERKNAKFLLSPLTKKKTKGIISYVWRSSTLNRNWSDKTHGAMLSKLLSSGYGVVVIDHEPQCQYFASDNLLNLSGKLSIRDSASIIDASNVCLTPDTGAFHLAAAVNTPTVAYMGSFPASERSTHKSLVVVNDEEPCGHLRLHGGCRRYTCYCTDEEGYSKCLTVAPQSVVQAIEKVLA